LRIDSGLRLRPSGCLRLSVSLRSAADCGSRIGTPRHARRKPPPFFAPSRLRGKKIPARRPASLSFSRASEGSVLF
jgi:hypothetical protein